MSVINEIYAYLKEQFKENADFDEQTNLIEEGLIDSMMVMQLINFLEKQFCIEIELETITAENFETVKSISELVEKMK
jgi:acyl carrier protein